MSVFDFQTEYIVSNSAATSANKPLSQIVSEELPLRDPALKAALSTSVPVPGSKEPGYSEIYRNGAFPNKVKSAVAPELDTYGKFFARNVARIPDEACLSFRKYDYVQKKSASTYSSISYKEANDRKKNFGAGLLYLLSNSSFKRAKDLESHRKIDSHVADYDAGKFDTEYMSFILTIFAPNRMEWTLTDLMCCSYAITNSSLYDTLGPDVSRYIMQMTESPVIVLDKHNIQTILNLKKQFPKDLENLILLVSMDPLDLEGENESRSFEDVSLVSAARDLGMTLIDMDRVERVGSIFPHRELPAQLNSTYTISFTSGTTGSKPKGVVLTQKAAGAGISFLFPLLEPPAEKSKMFAFLPLAHIFERQSVAYVLSYGGCVGFPQLGGTPLTLVEDLKIYKPHHMANVPRIFTKFEAAIKAATIEHPSSAFTRSLFEKVLDTKLKLQSVQDGNTGSHFVYDKLFLSKIRSKFGFDRMLFTITGSAPISVETIKFLKATLNVGFSQGYGLTESFAGMCVSVPHETTPGSCGAVGCTSEMKLKELPQMGYASTDEGGPRGELLLRGAQMFSHYYKNPEETAKSIDKDGWFHTGDVAKIDSKGRVYIIDRVKNFFKLAHGEYVTPEKVENTYLSANPILTQLFCHGDSLKNFLVGIAGIEVPLARQFLTEQCKASVSAATSDDEIVALINETEHRRTLLAYINNQASRDGKLQGFEKFHNIYFEVEPLRLDRDVVTPTSKLKRPVAAKFFGQQIDHMYKEGSLIRGNKL